LTTERCDACGTAILDEKSQYCPDCARFNRFVKHYPNRALVALGYFFAQLQERKHGTPEEE